jgi:SAM-dependent methyltransferase
MQLDVEELTEFYAKPLGQTVRRLLTHRIRARWRGLQSSTLMGLGHASPYLGAFRNEAQRLGALMPDSQGVVRWPREGPSHTVFVDDDRLPLRDGSVDRLLAVHCLEVAEHTRHLLREMWRVLAPEGRVILIVPNRRGVWARLDNTPFGQGRPYSRRQLEQLLLGAMFTPLDWGGALYFPPLGRKVLLRSSTAWERVGASVSPAFCGVLIVEASKELIAPIGKPAKVRAVRRPILQTQSARRSLPSEE